MHTDPDRHREEGWENLLDRKLRSLPDRRAPATLVPRVMAAVRARAERRWYRRAWRDWPPICQVLSLLAFSGVLGLATWAGLHGGGGEWVAGLRGEVEVWRETVAPFEALVSGLASAAASVLGSVHRGVWLGAAAICVVMYLSCVGFGTVFYQVAFSSRRNHERAG